MVIQRWHNDSAPCRFRRGVTTTPVLAGANLQAAVNDLEAERTGLVLTFKVLTTTSFLLMPEERQQNDDRNRHAE
ncbi:MAG: hypothetical protein JSS43_00405 [Proteobacteria bacterium]|nr:hypothetical protein [Pseudomonadota bacterium]